MGVLTIYWIVQMVPNRARHQIYEIYIILYTYYYVLYLSDKPGRPPGIIEQIYLGKPWFFTFFDQLVELQRPIKKNTPKGYFAVQKYWAFGYHLQNMTNANNSTKRIFHAIRSKNTSKNMISIYRLYQET